MDAPSDLLPQLRGNGDSPVRNIAFSSNERLTEEEVVAPALDQSAVTLPASKGWRTKAVIAADLRTMTFPPVRFIVPGLFGDGVTLLVSRPKLGKSWWALDVALAITTDRFTLGTIKPVQGSVLYLALED